jgi:hypothetical protein
MTVSELKSRMTVEELSSWITYREIVGPLNPLLRLDAAVARAVSPFVKGDKSSLMPYPKEPEQDATLEDFMAILTSAKVKKD